MSQTSKDKWMAYLHFLRKNTAEEKEIYHEATAHVTRSVWKHMEKGRIGLSVE